LLDFRYDNLFVMTGVLSVLLTHYDLPNGVLLFRALLSSDDLFESLLLLVLFLLLAFSVEFVLHFFTLLALR